MKTLYTKHPRILLIRHLLIFLLFTGTNVSAQQLNTSSFYELAPILHNPATPGSGQKAFIGGSFKTQWSSMPGSPKTGLLYGQTFLPGARLGLGGYLYHDVTGPTSRTGLQMAYAYHIPVKEKSSVSFGLEARLQQLSFDREKLQQELGSLDPVVTGYHTRIKADAGVGIAYSSPRFQMGAAVSQLVQSRYKLYELAGTQAEQSKLYRHYYLHGNYTFIPDEFTKVSPNLLVIYLPNAPVEVQGGIRMMHNDLLWYGLSWRARQGWMIAAGFKVKEKFTVGYSFDIFNAPLSVYQKGSSGHELMLQYSFR
ncbi:MAG TPA: PorP/SprF family type IX secretion system membrane protein [Flavisolibacter sp.]|jgi:type IX secretion system PorP/SprF family membrane protein|nr:PorP/SprF family type IX secretion system membrane protein [Flavisolibacter sp.]